MILCHLGLYLRIQKSELILKKMNQYIHVQQRLYSNPISCEKLEDLGYTPGSCKISEKISSQIINWPCIVPYDMEKTILKIYEDFFLDSHQ